MPFMHPTVHETEFRRASCLDSQSHRVMVDPSTDTSADRDSGHEALRTSIGSCKWYSGHFCHKGPCLHAAHQGGHIVPMS